MRPTLFSLLVLFCVGLISRAQAESAYFLVGLRHIYRLDAYPDPNARDRQAIEQDYLDAIDKAQQQFEADMTSIKGEEVEDNGNIHQNDRDAVQQNLEQDIEGAAEVRDENLSQLYTSCDDLRGSQPEFEVDQDGPYTVIGINFDGNGDISDASFLSEDDGSQGACPDDLAWNEVYSFANFMKKKHESHVRWIAHGKPLFRCVRVRGSLLTSVSPVRFFTIMDRKAWVNGRPPTLTLGNQMELAQTREQQFAAGLSVASHVNRSSIRGSANINRANGTSPWSSRYSNPPAKSQNGTGESTSRSDHHLF